MGSSLTESVRAELELLTPDEVCGLLKVKRDWLYDQVQEGRIPHLRMGRRLRFRPSEIQDWLSGTWVAPVREDATETPAEVRPRRGRPRKV